MSGGEYKWSLRKGGRKTRCPQCGKMRFVPFVLTADPSVLAGEEYGRCDREQSCGYFRYPGREVAAEDWRHPEPRPELPPALFNIRLVDYDAVRDDNTLFAAYRDLLGADRLRQVMAEYRCGTGSRGECVYYQCDGAFVRTAKAIMYDGDGHRLKDESGETLPVKWLHKARQHRQYMESHQLKQCLFGEHLLRKYPDAEVRVVEGEKTAVLMAAAQEQTLAHKVWVACGGSQMLKGAIDLSCLDGRKVALIPDHGQYWNWKRTADAHGWQCGNVEDSGAGLGLPDGYDIWDLAELRIKGIKNLIKN